MQFRMSVFMGCALVALAGGQALRADDESDNEKKLLQGKWESVTFEGTGLTKNSKSVVLVFKDDHLQVTIGTDIFDYEFALDVEQQPKQIDLTEMPGKVKITDRVNMGLYALNENELTVCFGGGLRPAKFELRPNNNDSLIKLKRARR